MKGWKGREEKKKGNLCHHIKGKKDYFHRSLNFIRTRQVILRIHLLELEGKSPLELFSYPFKNNVNFSLKKIIDYVNSKIIVV